MRSFRAVVVACLALCCLALSAAHAAPARAQTAIPDVVQDNIDSATEFYANQSGVASAPCDTACGDLNADLLRAPTAPKDPVPSRVIKSLVDRVPSLGSKVPWELPPSMTFAGWGPAGALVAANYYVWKVKVIDPIRKAFFVEAPKDVIDTGGLLPLEFNDGVGGTFISDPLPAGSQPDPIPLGLIAYNFTLDTMQRASCDSTCPGCSPHYYASIPSRPAGMVEYSWRWGYCGGIPYMGYGWRVPLEDSLTFLDSADAFETPDSPVTIDATGTVMTFQELKDRLTSVLTSSDPEYAPLGQWMCAVFGGTCQNPKDLYPTTPDCVGETPTACEQDFEDAGFTGDITTQTLSSDDAVMEQDAGKVTSTYPHAGIQIAARRDITLYANPATMPTMTAEETTIADTLVEQNPDTVNDTDKKTIARSCARAMAVAGEPATECVILPIMVAGNDQQTPALNDLQGLIRNSGWKVLNARITTGLSRGDWYENLGDPAPGCLDADKEPTTAQCDEFPFFSTLQAHGGTLNTMTPSIRWVPAAENNRQAQVIKQFYSNNNPGPSIPFHGCNLVKQAASDVFPNVLSAYIVAPMPYIGVPSTGICNKPVTP